jgi:hypothetical protein
MEETMCKSLVTITAALALVSLTSFVSDHAQAGSAVSAPSKYRAVHSAAITEFSSSSAQTKSSVPHR